MATVGAEGGAAESQWSSTNSLAKALASLNSLMTRPIPQPAPAPEPGVAVARGPDVQLPAWPAGRQGSLRRTLWNVAGSTIVGPSTTTSEAFVIVNVSPPLIMGAFSPEFRKTTSGPRVTPQAVSNAALSTFRAITT